MTVSGTWDGDQLDDALERIQPVMDGLDLPLGYGWNFGSEIQRAQQQQSEMGTEHAAGAGLRVLRDGQPVRVAAVSRWS